MVVYNHPAITDQPGTAGPRIVKSPTRPGKHPGSKKPPRKKKR